MVTPGKKIVVDFKRLFFFVIECALTVTRCARSSVLQRSFTHAAQLSHDRGAIDRKMAFLQKFN